MVVFSPILAWKFWDSEQFLLRHRACGIREVSPHVRHKPLSNELVGTIGTGACPACVLNPWATHIHGLCRVLVIDFSSLLRALSDAGRQNPIGSEKVSSLPNKTRSEKRDFILGHSRPLFSERNLV